MIFTFFPSIRIPKKYKKINPSSKSSSLITLICEAFMSSPSVFHFFPAFFHQSVVVVVVEVVWEAISELILMLMKKEWRVRKSWIFFFEIALVEMENMLNKKDLNEQDKQWTKKNEKGSTPTLRFFSPFHCKVHTQ